MRRLLALTAAASLLVAGCSTPSDDTSGAGGSGGDRPVEGADSTGTAGGTADAGESGQLDEGFAVTEHGTFDEGWSMAFLPGGEHLLVAERGGGLKLRDQATGGVIDVEGAPEVRHAGQGGLHDVIPGPTFADDGTVYLSWVRDHPDGAQGVVGRGTLDIGGGQLSGLDVIWEQTPAEGGGHFALRMLVQGEHLFVTSGDRQDYTPAQDTSNNLGAVVRLTLNRIEAGANYGWPEASMGVHYGGDDIPDHSVGDGFTAPSAHWVPAMSPGNLMIYRGSLFDGWRGSALLGGLSGQKIVRVDLDGDRATVAEEWDMGERIRAIDEAPDGSLWVLEDGVGGRLLQLRPK